MVFLTETTNCVVLPIHHSPSAPAQLEFLSDTGRTDDASKLAGGTEDSLETSADLLGLSIEELTGALLTRPLQVAREKFVKPNKVGEAQSARDALAKDVYLGIFNYLLKKINEATRYVIDPGAADAVMSLAVMKFFRFPCDCVVSEAFI